jgi:hypothetical protein
MLDFDIDLRPYLGYDIEFVQLGEQKPLFSPYLAVYYNYLPIERLFIRPELAYHQKGGSFNQNEYEDITYQVKINYLELPVSVGYSILNKPGFTWDLYLGGYVALNVKAIKRTGYYQSEPEKTTLDNASTLDGGLHIGTDFKYRVGENYILLDFRAFMGLANTLTVPEDQVVIYESVQDVRLTGFTFALGYEF